jgi:predicted MFS family arabinose efflux permease
MLSIESFVAYIGSFVGSAGLGYLAEHTSISLAWIVGGAILMVQLALYLSIDARRKDTDQRGNHAQETSVLKAG